MTTSCSVIALSSTCGWDGYADTVVRYSIRHPLWPVTILSKYIIRRSWLFPVTPLEISTAGAFSIPGSLLIQLLEIWMWHCQKTQADSGVQHLSFMLFMSTKCLPICFMYQVQKRYITGLKKGLWHASYVLSTPRSVTRWLDPNFVMSGGSVTCDCRIEYRTTVWCWHIIWLYLGEYSVAFHSPYRVWKCSRRALKWLYYDRITSCRSLVIDMCLVWVRCYDMGILHEVFFGEYSVAFYGSYRVWKCFRRALKWPCDDHLTSCRWLIVKMCLGWVLWFIGTYLAWHIS
jgi:hypothetical protein